MGKRIPIDIQKQGDVVLAMVKTEKGWRRERLLVIKAALEKQGIMHIAKQFSRSHTTIQDWINRYREGGVDKLLDKRKGNGPPSRLTEEMQVALKEQLEKGKWRTAQQAWDWLWDIVKDGICNRNWKDLDELEEALEKRLETYWCSAKKVFNLIGSSYLLSELNAI